MTYAIMQKIHFSRYKKVYRWLKRYAPGELFATIWALLGRYIANKFTHNPIMLGYAGARWENVCYYGYFLYKEYTDQKSFHIYNAKVSVWSIIVGMVSEFWPGELLDSFVVKPLFMMIGSKNLGMIWFIIGKYCADVIYYTIATLLYNHKTKKRIEHALSNLENKMENMLSNLENEINNIQ